MKQADLVPGVKVGHFTVIGKVRCFDHVTSSGVTRRRCVSPVRCVCGKEKEILCGNLTREKTTSCGCQGSSRIRVDDTESFIRAARKARGDFFDYSEVKYVNSETKVKIIDPEFGPFWILPQQHIRQGTGGPPERARRSSAQTRTKWTVEKIKAKAKELYGDRYDLSRITKSGIHRRIEVGCPDHGWWEISGRDFLKESAPGCPKCRVMQIPLGYKKGRLTVIREPYLIPRKNPTKRNLSYRVVDLQCDCGTIVEQSIVELPKRLGAVLWLPKPRDLAEEGQEKQPSFLVIALVGSLFLMRANAEHEK